MSAGAGRTPAETELRTQVEVFAPRSAREVESRRRMLAELDRLERPFDQLADEVHVTGSALVIGPRGLLLHRHKRLGIWLQPGGHIEAGESPAQAALREAAEETGIEVAHPAGGPRLVHIDVHEAYAGHIHLDTRYLLVGADQDPDPGAGESQAVRWFSPAEAAAVADPGLIDVLDRLWPGPIPGGATPPG
ncbi:MAG TPA: NUDIX domain-containing protein [Acidimicrobiales bacterium]|nr:NUDIX domain-containing protein [Acidimicrobiales bacterium]